MHPAKDLMLVLVLVLVAGIASCGPKSYMPVYYQLPSERGTAQPRSMNLKVVQEFTSTNIFGPQARENFYDFTGEYALYISEVHTQEIFEGVYSLVELFQNAFTNRLHKAGVVVLKQPDASFPTLEIGISEFVLDRDGNMWKTWLRYEARLIADGKIRATQSVKGNAERAKIMGTKGASTLISEIFTDTVNRLDIQRLLGQSGI